MGLHSILINSFLISTFGYASSQHYFELYNPYGMANNPKLLKDNPGLISVDEEEIKKANRILHMSHQQNLRTAEYGHLREIPKEFKVTGDSPKPQFIKYMDDIQHLADKENVTITYKVQIEAVKPKSKKAYGTKKPYSAKKSKSKKYNVPLKKKNMRLSNFEIIMRKLADNNPQKVNINPVQTTKETKTHEISTTTKIPVLKYKPIINRVRTNYAKKNLMKPVKKQEFTLQSKIVKRS